MSENILKFIVKEAAKMSFGSIIITFQDGRAVQVEKNEKFRIDRQGIVDGRISLNKQTLSTPILEKLRLLLCNIAYGQISISVKEGRPLQVEKLEKHRLSDLVDIGGDSI